MSKRRYWCHYRKNSHDPVIHSVPDDGVNGMNCFVNGFWLDENHKLVSSLLAGGKVWIPAYKIEYISVSEVDDGEK